LGSSQGNSKKIFIFGGSGLLGNHAGNYFSNKNYKVYSAYNNHKPLNESLNHIRIDILNQKNIISILKEIKPEIILNCSGLTSVEECEREKKKAMILHEEFPGILAKFSLDEKINYTHISTDHLWDGKKSFYKETDKPSPINRYGYTKAQGEEKVTTNNPNSLIIRTNFFGKGTYWRESFSDWAIRQLQEGNSFKGFVDVFYTPISISFLLNYMDHLMEHHAKGIYHVAGSERVSKYEFIKKLALLLKLDSNKLQKATYKNSIKIIERPLDMSLNIDKVSKTLKLDMPNTNKSIDSLN
jgi:dTDP-4-dehydrorhamnose reductase